ncbi:MAG TPA: hypothetical protein VKA85_09045 [Candidatus Limnocylindrales bacterium]|nr:hypothetical protein [Candidatus Limnocylindrales bacterium]
MRGSSGRRAVIAAAGGALVAVALLAPSAIAADPPAGIVLDDVVNVTVREASAAGAAPGAPIAGAEVTLLVTLNDFPEGELQSLTATTADDGIATFAAVARPEKDNKPTVHLEAHAHQESTSRDNGCVVGTSWDGVAAGTATEGPDELIVEASASSSISCPPKPVLLGVIHDAAGKAIAIASATLSVDTPPVGKPRVERLSVYRDGRFTVTLAAWDGDDGPAIVRVSVTGEVTRHATLANGCRGDYAQVGSRTVRVALEARGERPVIDIVTHEAVVAEACAAVGTPRPTVGGGGGTTRGNGGGGSHPVATLPPTDEGTKVAAAAGSATAGVAVVIVLVAAVAGLAAASLRRTRR